MKLTYNLISELHNNFGKKTVCIGLNYWQFLSDLNFTADTGYEKCDEYPEKAFHDTLSDFMEQLGEDKLELPVLFSLELDEGMSMLGLPFCYAFLMTDKEHFKQLCRLFEVDKETEEKCLCEDTDCIVIYTGMSLQK